MNSNRKLSLVGKPHNICLISISFNFQVLNYDLITCTYLSHI